MKRLPIAATLLAALSALGTAFSATPALAQSDSYRVEANDSYSVDLTICNPEVYVSVRGDGDTDLDFTVRDPNGQTVHSDYDYTDITFFTLYRQARSGCETYQMDVRNLGNVWNRFSVDMETIRADTASNSGTSSDGRNRAVSFVNNGKESVWYIYWANVASRDWGPDQLGSNVIVAGDSWQTTIDDGSGACRFNIRAVTRGGREILRNNVDVCSTYTINLD